MKRIAVLSDIHFGKFARSNDFAIPGEQIQDNSTGEMPMEEGLDNLLKEMHPSYMFVAGDLTSVGEAEEFYYCERKLISIAEKCGVPKKNIICSLGNHDVDWNISKIADEKIERDMVKGRYLAMPDEVKKCIIDSYQGIAASAALHGLGMLRRAEIDKQGPLPYSGIFEEDEFIVFCLNTGAFCTQKNEYAHGKLSREQLEWFDNMAAKYREDERKKIVLMHHHPFNYAYPFPTADLSLLEEGAEFVECATKNKIDIVIHGHRHHPRVESFQGQIGNAITFLCAGSLAVNAKHRSNGEIPNMLHFIDIDKDKDYYVLHNYKYTGPEGWKEVVNEKVTPLDAKMLIGKVFSEQEKEEAIQRIERQDGELLFLQWDDLEDCLKFMRYSDLNDLLGDYLGDRYNIVGRFPADVVLKRRSS